MEPASSSDDDSSVDEVTSRRIVPQSDSESESESDSDSDSGEDKHGFEELPSDDSCLGDGSDDDNDDDGYGYGYENFEVEEDIPLADRIFAKRNNGIEGKAKSAATKKSKALELAQKRLVEMKREKKKRSRDSDSDDESDSDSDSNCDDHDDNQIKAKKKKSKHVPTVASSSRSAFFSRGAPDLNTSGIGVEIGANKYKARDPRMQSLSGHFDQNVFEKRYDFLEDMQDKEIDSMRQRCKAWKTTGKKGQKLRKKLGMTAGNPALEEDEAELKRMVQERSARRDAKMRSTAKSTVKKKLRDDVAAGKRGAYYLKKRDMKKLELEAKFEQLRKVGGDSAVNKVMAKRRKRKMGKDSGLMGA